MATSKTTPATPTTPAAPVTPAVAIPKRKTIQVVSSIDAQGKYLILAVCDDGTIWKLHNLYEGPTPKWKPFVAPPEN